MLAWTRSGLADVSGFYADLTPNLSLTMFFCRMSKSFDIMLAHQTDVVLCRVRRRACVYRRTRSGRCGTTSARACAST